MNYNDYDNNNTNITDNQSGQFYNYTGDLTDGSNPNTPDYDNYNAYINYKEEKKGTKFSSIIIVLIMLLGSFVLGWFSCKKEWVNLYDFNVEGIKAIFVKDDKKNNDNTEKEEKKDEAPSKDSKYTFKDEKSFNFKYNEKEHKILAYYYVDKENINNGDKFVVRRDIYVGDRKLIDIMPIDVVDSEELATKVIENDKIDNAMILKDEKDEKVEYMVLFLNYNIANYGNLATTYNEESYIVSDSGRMIKRFVSKDYNKRLIGIIADDSLIDGKSSVLRNTLANYIDAKKFPIELGDKVIYSTSRVEIVGNALYYLIIGDTELKEYKILVNNNTLNESQTRTYSLNRCVIFTG